MGSGGARRGKGPTRRMNATVLFMGDPVRYGVTFVVPPLAGLLASVLTRPA